jgi:hypothetical protein
VLFGFVYFFTRVFRDLTSLLFLLCVSIFLSLLHTHTDTEQVMLFPHSTEAGSLLVKISVGSFCHLPDGTTFALHDDDTTTPAVHVDSTDTPPNDDKNRYTFWGLRGEVQASTVYEVADMSSADCDLDPSQATKNSVEVVYENCVCLAIEMDSKEKAKKAKKVQEGGAVWGGAGGGGGGGEEARPSGRVSFRAFQLLAGK